MKIEEIALMNAFWDRFDKSMENMFKAIQEENTAQRKFILDLVKAGSDATLKGVAGRASAGARGEADPGEREARSQLQVHRDGEQGWDEDLELLTSTK